MKIYGCSLSGGRNQDHPKEQKTTCGNKKSGTIAGQNVSKGKGITALKAATH
jgi:hypothetical protein